MATTVLQRPALDDALKRIYRRVALARASEKAISKQPLAGKLSFSFYQVTGRERAPAALAERPGEHDQTAVFPPCTTRARMPSFKQLRI